MSFNRSGIWTQPTEEDKDLFVKNLQNKAVEITPTPEMIQAITSNLKENSVNRIDIFDAIGRLKGSIDIVIPIYDGLHVLKPCINSIVKHSQWAYRLILVDDCSPDPMIDEYLKQLPYIYPNTDIKILRNQKNRGFAATVNRGVAEGKNPYICILNSDTLVTKGWIVKQLIALEIDPKNVIVNPATNNTALINVPMYSGCNYLDMADALSKAANAPQYNEIMPTGFCFTLRRNLWDEIGPFDSSYISYGEDLLDLNLPVLTNNGWLTVGDLKPNDIVFSEKGEHVKIIGLTPIKNNRRCYEITFDNGEKITTDYSHRWRISTKALIQAKSLRGNRETIRSNSHKKRLEAKKMYDEGVHYKEVAKRCSISITTAQLWLSLYRSKILDKHYGQQELILTTEDMFLQGIFCKSNSKLNCFNFKIPVAPALKFDEKNLLIEPYLLGAWLGDGNSYDSRITSMDPEIIQEFKNANYIVTKYKSSTIGKASTFNIGSNNGTKGSIKKSGISGSLSNPFTFKSKLKELNLIKNKHIPSCYLFGSYNQRLALLQGLMDTDGHCTKKGKCSFDNTNINLINSVEFLIRSLGIKTYRPQPSRKKECKDCHRVIFRAEKNIPVFRLPRKLQHQVLKTRNKVKYHAIIDICPVKPKTVRCVQINSPNKLFLVSKSLIATRNSDFWFNAIKQTDKNGIILKNRGVLADNTYVFHERSTSFSQLGNEKHMSFRQEGSKRFHQLYPDFQSWRQGFNEKAAVHHLRNKLPKSAFKKEYKGNIAWVVKSAGPCGGMSFIADIVNQLIEEGYNAKVCVVPENYDEQNPPNLTVVGNLRMAPVLFKTAEEFVSTFTKRVFSKGKVFAGVSELSSMVHQLEQTYKNIEGYNHVQSYDVELAKIMGKEDLAKILMESYKKLPNIVSSNWVSNTLRDNGCEVQGVILPGVNPDLFHPRGREKGDERFTIAVIVNNNYVFKGTDWACQFIKALKPEKNTEIRVLVIGSDALKDVRGVTYLGSLPQTQMAKLLGEEIDILVDPSEIHSYGLPALEALYSGCAVLTRENKGIHEYAKEFKDFPDRVFIENQPEEAAEIVLDTAKEYLKDLSLERKTEFSSSTDRAANVRKFIDFVFPKVEKISHRIEVITPHLRKHGGPTTIISNALQLKALGHNVGLSVIYTDWNPEVLKMARGINIRTVWNNIEEDVELVIINSDNPFAKNIMEKYPNKKYIMLKLSHNPRFQVTENDNLSLPWDHIVTSTEWLKDVCLNPLADQGWTHQAWQPNLVTTVGYYHYSHDLFSIPLTNRTYGNAAVGFRMGTLIHNHPLKGTKEALGVIEALKRKYEANFHAVGFGEIKAKLPGHMQYIRSATRDDMAHILKQLDIWYGASHSEGLGRMALEAMSAGVAVVATDTKAEFLEHEKNCLLYPIGNPQAGAEAVDRLANDQQLFTNLVVNGYNTAATASDPSRLRQNLNNVIQQVLK